MIDDPEIRKWIGWAAWGLYGLLCVPIMYVAILLLTTFETGFARAMALGLVLPFASPLLVLSLRPLSLSRWSRCGMIAVVNLMVFFSLISAVPSGETPPDSEISQVFLSDYRHPRWSLLNILPELEQLNLAHLINRRFGPITWLRNAWWLDESVIPIYRSLRERPEYVSLGSVTRYTLLSARGGPYWAGHVYRCVPGSATDERLPVVIAVHGMGGNSKAFLHTWEQFSSENDCIVLCPSFGIGVGHQYRIDEALEAFETVRRHAVTDLPGDPERVYLAGWSAGGFGVCAAARANPTAYEGLIFISPAIDVAALCDPRFVAAWEQSPILCVTGSDDPLTSPEMLQANVQQLRAAGLRIHPVAIPDEDHDLLFNAPEKVYSEIRNWLHP